MAIYYVWSAAVGTGTGATWANAYTNLTAALSGKVAGDVFYLAHDHAESTAAAITLTFPGTEAAPNLVYCVDRAGSVPPVSADLRTTAQIITTANSAINIGGASNANQVYIYGVIFKAGTGAVAAGITWTTGAAGNIFFDSCSLRKLGTSGTSLAIALFAPGVKYTLRNTIVNLGAVGDSITVGGDFRWINTAASAIAGGFTPTSGLFATGTGSVLIEAVNLTALGANQLIRGGLSSACNIVIKDCRLGSGAIASTISNSAPRIQVIRTDNADRNYRQEIYHYCGVLTTETSIVRTGGASDGTTPISWKVVTTANSKWIKPFECFPISIWNETVGSNVTVTVECRGAAIPNNDEVWMDVEYFGTAGVPLGGVATTTKADNLATGAACTSSSETWGGGTASFKLSATVTPQEKGPITVYVKLAKVSSTFYIDPKLTLS